MAHHSEFLPSDPIGDISVIANSDFFDELQLLILNSPAIQGIQNMVRNIVG